MKMADPIPTFSHLFSTVLTDHPELAYIHVVEPRADGANTRDIVPAGWSNDFIRDIVRKKARGTKVISAGAYTRETAIETADAKDDLIAFGRLFISNVRMWGLVNDRVLMRTLLAGSSSEVAKEHPP